MKLINRNVVIEIPRVEILPLIDIVFLVLIAFIYASMFLTSKTGLPVDLPGSSSAEPEKDEVITLTITDSGKYYLGDNREPLQDLEAALKHHFHNQTDKRLYIKADKGAEIDSLVKAMDIAERIGLPGLSIATDNRNHGAQDE